MAGARWRSRIRLGTRRGLRGHHRPRRTAAPGARFAPQQQVGQRRAAGHPLVPGQHHPRLAEPDKAWLLGPPQEPAQQR
jgi:hypothetical protein